MRGGGGPSGRISVSLVSGGGQTAVVGHELTDPLVVEVTDASGNPVGGQLVNFVVTSGEGHMFAGAAETRRESRPSTPSPVICNPLGRTQDSLS